MSEVKHLCLGCHVNQVGASVEAHIGVKVGFVDLAIIGAWRADTNFNLIGHQDRHFIIQLNPGQDETDRQERFPIPQLQVADIVDAGVLQIGQESRVIDMALGIKVPIADNDGVKEMKIGHVIIILEMTSQKSDGWAAGIIVS